MSGQPSEHALDILKDLESLPVQAKFCDLSVQISRKIRKEGMLQTFDFYNNKFGGKNESIPLAKIAVNNMTPGGDTKLYTLNYSLERDRVDFVCIAVRMTQDSLLDYVICTYAYKEPQANETIQTPISTTTTHTKKRLWGIFNMGSRTSTTTSIQIDVRRVNVAIKEEIVPYLEAAFMFELKRRGLMVMNKQTEQLELTL